MKVLLFCTTVVLLFFISEDVKEIVKGKECNPGEFMETRNKEEHLFCALAITYHDLCASFASVIQDGMQLDQEKAISFTQRFAGGIGYTGKVIRGCTVRVNQFTAFLSGRHLHGFYIFCLSRLLI